MYPLFRSLQIFSMKNIINVKVYNDLLRKKNCWFLVIWNIKIWKFKPETIKMFSYKNWAGWNKLILSGVCWMTTRCTFPCLSQINTDKYTYLPITDNYGIKHLGFDLWKMIQWRIRHQPLHTTVFLEVLEWLNIPNLGMSLWTMYNIYGFSLNPCMTFSLLTCLVLYLCCFTSHARRQ